MVNESESSRSKTRSPSPPPVALPTRISTKKYESMHFFGGSCNRPPDEVVCGSRVTASNTSARIIDVDDEDLGGGNGRFGPSGSRIASIPTTTVIQITPSSRPGSSGSRRNTLDNEELKSSGGGRRRDVLTIPQRSDLFMVDQQQPEEPSTTSAPPAPSQPSVLKSTLLSRLGKKLSSGSMPTPTLL